MSHLNPNIGVSRPEEIRSQRIEAQQTAELLSVEQEASQEAFTAWVDEGAFTLANARSLQNLQKNKTTQIRAQREEEVEQAEEIELSVEKIETMAEGYSKKNPELQKRSLLFLRNHVKSSDSKEELLKKVLETYPDPSLADEALEYLIEVHTGALQDKLKKAKEDLQARYGREVAAGRNINQEARTFSEKGLGTATALRDLYRAITGHPRDAPILFTELSSRFPYEQMKIVIDFILHALGQDLKSKGPSIDKGELHRLVSESRSMQAILGIFRFFKSRMPLIRSSFERSAHTTPHALSFEQISKIFMIFLQERYPSPDKVIQMATSLGLPKDIPGQIIIYTQMRDALRQVAPKLFRSEQHRQDILKSFLEAIERLDDELDEEDEDDEK